MSDFPFPDSNWDQACVSRLGLAHLTQLAFQGSDLYPLWTDMMDRVTDDAMGAGIGMDLSVIAQLRGDKTTGLVIQRDLLKLHQVFSLEKNPSKSSLRVLALATASDIGANTPIEFLIQGQDIALATLYISPDAPPPPHIPAHDVAIVVSTGSEDGDFALSTIERLAKNWPVPVLNLPAQIRNLERDRLYHRLAGISGLHIPPTLRLSRNDLEVSSDLEFPRIIRPLGSHAGFGLEKLENAGDLGAYLVQRGEEEFFVSPFIDYSDENGMFRKYRVAIIDGCPFPVHMAIADQWKVWYLNADMALNAEHRIEEAKFMQFFDENFGRRHARAFTEMARRLDLEYFLIDCAETRDGRLLIFEADHCAIVHDMDPISVYPYKPAAMRRIFDAFGGMLKRRANNASSRAA